MTTTTDNLNLNLYEDNDPADLRDGYNESMDKLDTVIYENSTAISNKADAADMTAKLAKKADAADMTAKLAKKADAADMTDKLAKKADKSDIDKMLAGEVNVIEFGADPTFTTDSTSAIKNAIAKAIDDSKWQKDGDIINNPAVVIPAGHYIVSDTIELPFFIHFATRGNVTIDWNGEDTNKPVFWVNQYFTHDISPATTKTRTRVIDGTNGRLTIVNKSGSKNSVIGIEVGDRKNISSQPGVSLYEIAGVSVYGFYTGVHMNSYNHYLGYYDNVISGWNYSAFKWGKDGSSEAINSGENTTFVNCAIGTSNIGFLFNANGFEGTFVGCSFDFDTDAIFSFNNAHNTYLNIHGGHIESPYFTKASGGTRNRINIYGTHFWWTGIDDNYFSSNDQVLINAHDAVFSLESNSTLSRKYPTLTNAKVITSGCYTDKVVSMFENKLNNSAFNSSQDTDSVTTDILKDTILDETRFNENPNYSVKLTSNPPINVNPHYKSSGKYLSLQRSSVIGSNPYYNIYFKPIKTYGKRLINFGFMMAVNNSQFPKKNDIVLHAVSKDINGDIIYNATQWTLTNPTAYNSGDCIAVAYPQIQLSAGTDSVQVSIEMLNIADINQIRYFSDFCLSLQ